MLIFLVSLILLPLSLSYPEVSLNILYSDILIKQFQLNFQNYYEYQSTYNEDLQLYGKICYTNNYESYLTDCKNYFYGYNSKWILLIEDLGYLNDVAQHINNKNESDVESIIFNYDYIKDDITIDLSKNVIPVLFSDNLTINNIKLFDIHKEKLNYFVKIIYSVKLTRLVLTVLFYTNLVITVLLVFTACYWNKLIKDNSDQSLQLQKSLTFLPYLRIFISFIFCYYIYLAYTLEDQGGKIMSHYIGVIFLTLLSVYKTFFWFIILLLAYGWIIYKETISRENLKKFVLYYIVIYILVFFDPFLDDMIKQKLFKFKVSDLKNFFIYSGFTLIIVTQAKKTYNKFLMKYIYAREFLQIYCETLKLKMQMIINIIILSILYTFSYIVIVVLIREMYPDQTNNNIFTDSILKINEDIYLFYLLYIFRPRKFPIHFNLPIEDDNISSTNIFLVSLPRTELLSNCSSFGKNIIKSTTSENSPVVVINPIIYENRKQLMNVNVLDKISVCLNS